MRQIGVLALLAACWTAQSQPLAAEPLAGQPVAAVSLSPGDAQVAVGRRLALQTCAACHGASLEGRYGPALTGAKFTARWQGRSGAELRAFIASSMPLGRAGTLDDAQTLALVAYILRANGLLGGPELTPEVLKTLNLFDP